MILKNILLFTLLFCCQPYIVWGQNAESICPEPIKVGFNDWAPYSWVDASGNAVGLDIDMLTLVANNLGCQVNFIHMPIKRAHQMLKSGSLDMMMGASYTKEREKYAFFTQSYRDEEIRLFTKADALPQISIEKWQDIFSQKLTLLVPTFGWYGKDYLQSKAELQNQGLLVISQDAAQSVRMLAYKRGDILIGDSISLPYIANQSENLALEPLPLLVDSNKIHFMLSKQTKSSGLLQEINNAISTLSNHGALAKVVSKWQNISVAQTPKTSTEEPTQTPAVIDINGAFSYTGQGQLSR
jgi:polar amino acid transport system substrate-binding protein